MPQIVSRCGAKSSASPPHSTELRTIIVKPRTPVGLLLMLIVTAATCHAQGLPLEVVNPTNQHVFGHPVTFGIPVPETLGFTDPNAHWFAVRDSTGQSVPRQFRVLSRWQGERQEVTKPIKWVQISFLADIPPQSTVIYYLGHGFSPPGSISITDQVDRIIVSPTPGTSMTINKNTFRLFESVIVDGQTVVAAPGGGLRMKDAFQNMVNPVITETIYEEWGAVRSVVRQRGLLNNLNFTIRYTFYSGKKNVLVDFQLVNRQKYGHFMGLVPGTEYFDHLKLWLPMEGAAPTITSRDATRSIGTQAYSVSQDFTWLFSRDLNANFHYGETINGITVGSGNRYLEGSLDLSTANGGVTASVDRFYENFPKAFNILNGNELEVALWPEGGHGPEFRGVYASPNSPDPIDPLALENYRFEGGRAKNHRVSFDFHQGLRTPTQVRAAGELIQRAPVGRTPGWWFAKSGAHGRVLVEKRAWPEIGMQRYEGLLQVIADDNAADPQNNIGQVGFPGFRNRGGYGGGVQWYGWENYGDIFWADGPSSLHYDWPYSVMLNWARGGDYGFYEQGRDMVAHRRDYDQNHTNSPDEFWRGAQFYEKGWWHGNNSTGRTSHTWLGGLLLNYVLTGDEMSREAALEGVDFMLRNSPRYWNGLYGARIPGWTIENLLDAYTYLGMVPCLVEAGAGVARFQELENNWGGLGYVMNASTPTNPFMQPFMHTIMFNAAARYTILSGDPSYLGLLWRMKTFLATTIVPGSGPPTAMTLPSVKYLVYPNGTHTTEHRHHIWYMANVFSHSALLFGEQGDKDLAWMCFNIGARFHQSSATTILNFDEPSSWSKQSMAMAGNPSTESKVMAGIMYQGLTYMAARTVLSGW